MGDASRDTRLYEICSPIYHGKGVHFVRTFSPAFLAGLALKRDKFSNLRMHLRGLDPGGTPAMTAAQIAAAPGTIPGANPHQGSNAGGPANVQGRAIRVDEPYHIGFTGKRVSNRASCTWQTLCNY